MRTCCCHSKSFKTENQVTICLNDSCANHLAPTSIVSTGFVTRLSGSLVIIFILCFCINDYSTVSQAHPSDVYQITKRKQVVECTKDNLKEEIRRNKIICPDEVFAQIMIESAHLSSFLYKRANNMLGMRFPCKRSTTASGIYLPAEDRIIKGSQAELKKYCNQNNYAVYDSWEACVADYKLWQDECFKLKEKYLTFLGTYYAEDTEYVSKIKKMAKK